MGRTLVVCPLKNEFRHLVSSMQQMGYSVSQSTLCKMPVAIIPSKTLTIAIGGHGKVQFGIQTQYYISKFSDLSAILCVGAGGGLAEHLNVGDIVVATKTIEHDYQEKFSQNAPLPEFFSEPQLRERFTREAVDDEFKIHVGAIASGDEDIIDPERANALLKKTGALSVAWEGSGGARAALFNQIPFLEIRAITDNARHEVTQSFSQNLAKGMANIAKLLCRSINP